MRKIPIILLLTLLIGCSSKKETKPTPSVVKAPDTIAVQKRRFDFMESPKAWLFKNLSNQFDIQEKVFRYKEDTAGVEDSSIVTLTLIDKKSKTPIDTISITSTLLFTSYFENPKDVVSRSTQVDIKGEGDDNYYGDLVVADLNFDNKDDVAILSDMGGNAGPAYSFFIQDENGKFILNKFLTDSMCFFPTKINKTNQTLTTYGHAGVAWVGENIYGYDPTNNAWAHKSYRVIGPPIHKSNK